MDKQPLIIGIDFTNEYCQACYYNLHHARPESVTCGASVSRFMIPAALCYNEEKKDWLIGEEAMLYAEETGNFLYKNLLGMMLSGEKCSVGEKRCGYETMTAVYFGKVIEMIQVHSGLMHIETITVTLRKVNLLVKQKIEEVFDRLGIDIQKIKIQNYAESFAYFVLNEDESLWKDGSILFDFGADGFYAKQLTFTGGLENPLLYVNEHNYSIDLCMRDLASSMLRREKDVRLTEIYDDIRFTGSNTSVFFTGTGFSELWFKETLKVISRNSRVFKGNNLYVKGACLSGFLRVFKKGRDYPIVCKGRTKASIAVAADQFAMLSQVEMSRAACDWYDAGSEREFILTEDKKVTFFVTSLVSREKTKLELNLDDFPDRPDKATRVKVSVKYINEWECEISVTDMGFGQFYKPSGICVKKNLNLEGYI